MSAQENEQDTTAEAVVSEWEIVATATGSAVFMVRAASEDEAREIAYRDHLCGIIIEGGESGWEIESCKEFES